MLPPDAVVPEPDALLLDAAPPIPPNNPFCSVGLEAVLPKRPPEVPDEGAAALLLPPPRFPKENVGGPRLLEAPGAEEPNKPPEAGALDVVALLGWPPELALPKSDMVYDYV